MRTANWAARACRKGSFRKNNACVGTVVTSRRGVLAFGSGPSNRAKNRSRRFRFCITYTLRGSFYVIGYAVKSDFGLGLIKLRVAGTGVAVARLPTRARNGEPLAVRRHGNRNTGNWRELARLTRARQMVEHRHMHMPTKNIIAGAGV